MKRYYLMLFVLLSVGFSATLLSNGITVYQDEYSGEWVVLFDARPSVSNGSSFVNGNDFVQDSLERAGQYRRQNRQAASAHLYSCPSRSSLSLPSLIALSKQGHKVDFTRYPGAAQAILRDTSSYKNEEHIDYLKTLPGYEEEIDNLYSQYVGAFRLTKLAYIMAGKYHRGFEKKIIELKREIETKKEQKRQYESYNASQKFNHHFTTAKSYNACIYECSNVAYSTFKKYNYDEGPAFAMVENALESLKGRQLSAEQIIFNLSLVNHIVSGVEKTSNPLTPINRLVDGCAQGLTVFMAECNIQTQVGGIVKSVVALAHLVADITVGKFSLPEASYNERIDQLLDIFLRCPLHNISQMTFEEWMKTAASVTASIVFFSSASIAFRLFRFINAVQVTRLCCASAGRYLTCFKSALKQEYTKAGYISNPKGKILLCAPERPSLLSAARNLTPQAMGCPKAQFLLDTEKYMFHEAQQITAALRPKYDLIRKGFEACAKNYIKFPYNHIFRIEVHPTKRGKYKISGFHFDHMNALEKSEVIEFRNRFQDEYGFYRAELYWNGHKAKEKASFFPAHWLPDDVLNAIVEAYDDFIKKGAKVITANKGSYVIQGNISTGHIIEMVITESGKMKTAYPVIRNQ